ncbi:D-aminoacyl-tRNA deacylase [Halovenus aranensis]|uniref:D-aminoacyl-tRNA deacylase n=1 Tax=Halovenus aranensis TaxID=890420 RepID=A0A1G8VSY7_9EURY|nr:D-aminoacyl-tRNA deacylase [Halovenus aranensis]SDJ69099.1 D-aminoacyl-tRNA deacylase [Halovenus aranensis]
MLGILVSRADSASVHIGEQLRAVADWETREDDSRPDGAGGGTVYETEGAQLREFGGRHLDIVRPAEAFDGIDLLAVASRHAGETGPLLTAHHTGNVGPAEHGGDDNALAEACPNALGTVREALERHAPPDYEVGIECTHHGPTDVGVPSLFVEVGSAEPQWDDPDAARAVAQAILDLCETPPHRPPENGSWTDGSDTQRRRQLVGIGGGHYAPRFERVMAETDWTVGHILADWGLDALGDLDTPAAESVLRQAFAESASAYALVEGTAAQRVESLGYRAVSETWVRETDGVPLGFVRAVEDDVMTVDAGLRFGEPARDGALPDTYRVVELPADLLAEARGIDREATYEALAATALAFGTDQGGTRPTGPLVLGPDTDRERVVEALLDVLASKYDSVEVDEETVVASQRVLDDEKARTLGVPEGPAFGKLAAGKPVEVDGETIPPEAVHDERTSRFPLSPE